MSGLLGKAVSHLLGGSGSSSSNQSDRTPVAVNKPESNRSNTPATASTSSSPTPIDPGMRLPVGTTVRKDFGVHGWFTGTVTEYSFGGAFYRVVYSDGDAEDVDHDTLLELLYTPETENAPEAAENSKKRKAEEASDEDDMNADALMADETLEDWEEEKKEEDDGRQSKVAKKAAVPQRQSQRERTSTLTFVDGHAVKKVNNYQVKGFGYAYNENDDSSDPKNARKAAPKPKPARKAPAPRVLSQAEIALQQQKKAVEARVAAKQADKLAFLNDHMSALTPFCEPKVLQTLSVAVAPKSTTADENNKNEEYMQPDAITGDLRDYQLQGLNWMSRLYQQNISMILGDEMGLGKTLQTISLVCHLKEKFGVKGPSLVICPLSVLYSWCSEIEKWAPSLRFLRLHGNPEVLAKEQKPRLDQYDIVVTTYEMAKAQSLCNRLWYRQFFNLVVLDEGHRIKGLDTQISQAVRKLHAECRLILTGTPLANNLVELYSLLNFLEPRVFTTAQPFADAFDLTLNVVDSAVLNKAHHLLKVFMLRRLKTEVEKLMPKKVETKVICPLSNTQLWWYKALLLKDMAALAGGSNAQVLNNLVMQLRKACIHPFLFPGAEDIETTTLQQLVGASGKLAVLDKLLCSLYRKGHRVVLFSQFTSVLDILEDYASMRAWKYCRFDGATLRAKRNFIVQSFNAPDSDRFLFLMSTRSGGMGLNLQTADTCILFDSDWNPQPDIQAMARVHRIGQTKTVHVYRLVTEGTVEERMVERAQKKLYLDKMVTRDGVADATTMAGEEETDKLMSTLRFGCDAVFGQGDNSKNLLPSDEDIEVITDRSRTEDFSTDKLKGGAEVVASDFDATREFTSTLNFSGVDFKALRAKYQAKHCPKDVGAITDAWIKRQRKNRIKLVDGIGSGYGSAAVPVLAANDYDLETGEKSVFERELNGRGRAEKAKTKVQCEVQDFCQACGDGGLLVCCPRCPIGLHLECAGVAHEKHLLSCSHHHCSVCSKSQSSAGGMLFVCNACPNAYCEDHVPSEVVRMLEGNERMAALGYHLKHGVYIHCSAQCEEVAIKDLGFIPPKAKERMPCPPPLDVSDSFGGKVDDSVATPEKLIVEGKRQRKKAAVFEPHSSNVKDKGNLKPSSSVVLPAKPDYKEEASSVESASQAYVPGDDDSEVEVVGVKPAGSSTLQSVSNFAEPKPPPNRSTIATMAAKPLSSSTNLAATTTTNNPTVAAAPSVGAMRTEQFPGKPLANAGSLGTYEIGVPMTTEGLLLNIGSTGPTDPVVFRGYRRFKNGQPGPAERSGLVRNINDILIAINGSSVEGKSFPEISDLLCSLRSTHLHQNVLLRFRLAAAPVASESKYSAARVRERMEADGSVAPVTEPKKTKGGLYMRPAGRGRNGMEWCAVRGIWVPAGSLNTAQR